MDEQQWRPLFQRDSEEPTDFDVLHEGIPDWLSGSLARWLADRAAEGTQAMIFRLERRMHVPLAEPRDRQVGSAHTQPSVLIDRYWRSHPDDDRLTLLDAILHDMQVRDHASSQAGDDVKVKRGATAVVHRRPLVKAANGLGVILSEGGSAWSAHVGAPAWSLVRRVNEATAELARAVSSPETDASRKIRLAWHACYRHGPDPDAAYRDAVLAVEAVTIPVTIPDSPRSSLGGVISHIRDTLPRWSVGGLDAKEVASGQMLLDMLMTLWHNQERHARADGTIVDVSQAEAEAAVSLAVTLVHWFTTGLVQKSEIA